MQEEKETAVCLLIRERIRPEVVQSRENRQLFEKWALEETRHPYVTDENGDKKEYDLTLYQGGKAVTGFELRRKWDIRICSQ